MKLLLIICITVLMYSCSNQRAKGLDSRKPIGVESKGHIQASDDSLLYVEQAVGVVALTEFEEGDTVKTFNRDNSTWYQFSFYYNEQASFQMKDGFTPFAFHPDYFLLVLKCKEIEEDRFKVFVNDSTYKYVDKNNKLLKFYSWHDFILEYDLSINASSAKVYAKSNKQSKRITNYNTDFFFPTSIKGDWLEVRWEDMQTEEAHNGWIVWKQEDKLTVDLVFF